jgi:hypothetical protein
MRKKGITPYSNSDIIKGLFSDFELESDYQLNHFFYGLRVINPIAGGTGGIWLGDLYYSLSGRNQRPEFFT